MGYYSTMEQSVRVKKDKLEAFKDALKTTNDDRINWMLETFFVNDEGWIDCEDWNAKWNEDEALMKFLAPFLEAGDITFVGEDGERWGYRFDGKGGIKRLMCEINWIENGELN